MTLISAVAIGLFFFCGTFLLWQPHLAQIVLALMMYSHGTHLLIFMMSKPLNEVAPFKSEIPNDLQSTVYTLIPSDPFTQAVILTSIVISVSTLSLLLNLVYKVSIRKPPHPSQSGRSKSEL